MMGAQQAPKLRPLPQGHGEVGRRAVDSVEVELTGGGLGGIEGRLASNANQGLTQGRGERGGQTILTTDHTDGTDWVLSPDPQAF